MSERRAHPARELSADSLLGRGRGIAAGLLLLRVVRALSVTLLAAGIVVAVVSRQVEVETIPQLDTMDGLSESFASPFAVLAIGVVLRFSLGPAALLLALVTVLSTPVSVTTTRERRRRISRWTDALRTAAGYRSLGWTVAVKHEAADRLGRWGTALTTTELLVNVLTVLTVVSLLFLG